MDAQTLKTIEDVCLDKGIRQLHFETHWIHRREIADWKAHFAGLGIQLKLKMGVETFDPVFRREVMNKGMGDATPEEIADYADEVCLLLVSPVRRKLPCGKILKPDCLILTEYVSILWLKILRK